jgi:hypothetical protein
VKSAALIADALSEWRPVRNAPDLAEELFQHLDSDEIERLARRAFTDEVRTGLRRKDADGVPLYTSVIESDDEGKPRRVYKQTALFDVADYEVAIAFYVREARANNRVALALIADCQRRLGVQLRLGDVA